MIKEFSEEYGLQRLMLINSANYEYANLPLDASVSLVGDNNSGKTSLINALQFLFIRNFNQMKFGAYDKNDSRRFYFPSSSSYILLEMQLKKNLVVIGCVGKGVTHNYEYFSYAGSLKKEYFETEDGFIVEGPKLVEHLGKKGVSAYVYRRPSDFFDDLYGKSDLIKNRPDIRLFSTQSNLSETFQEVLVKTLNLKQLDSQDVKRFLLQIIGATYESEYDFKKVWQEAFQAVEARKKQFKLCERLTKRIENLENAIKEVRDLRGKIGSMKPLIDEALEKWDFHKRAKESEFNGLIESFNNQISVLQGESDLLKEANWNYSNEISALEKEDDEMNRLSNQFSFVIERSHLEEVYIQKDMDVSQKKTTLQTAKKGDLSAINRKIKGATDLLERLNNELHNGDRTFKKRIKKYLSVEEQGILFGLINEQILVLDAESIGDIETFATKFKKYLNEQGDILYINGLTIARNDVRQDVFERNVEDIEKDINSLQIDIASYIDQKKVLEDRDRSIAELMRLESELNDAKKALDQFDRLQDLQKNEAERKRKKDELNGIINENSGKIKEYAKKQSVFLKEIRKIEGLIEKLNKDDLEIGKNKELRIDDEPFFGNILDLPHSQFFFSRDVYNELNDILQNQKTDCVRLKERENYISGIMQDFLAVGFTKFFGPNTQDERIDAIINFSKTLDDEEQAIQKDMRTAISQVANGLKRLEHQYQDFCTELTSFNAIVQKRKVSDLEKMSFESTPLPALDAIKTFTKYSSDNEDTYNLFSLEIKSDSTGNAELNKARDVLLKVCSENDQLRLEHLFELSFIVCKKGGIPKPYKDIDKIASNGTILVAKLLYGLTLLYRMTDAKDRVISVCYLDEAASLDAENQKNLILSAKELGFNLLFASPEPQTTARYCVAIGHVGTKNIITEKQIQILETNIHES